MKKVLFLCSQNRLRSPTAEAVFAQTQGLEVMSAGLDKDAENPVSGDLLEWADIIFVMEKSHRNRLSKKFRPFLKSKRVIVLGIPDEYDYMDEALVRLLKDRVPQFLGTY